MGMLIQKIPILILYILLSFGCSDLNEFSTKEGNIYRGSAIQGNFIREGFASDTELEMSFHVDRVEFQPDQYGMGGPGLLQTSDGRFVNAPLEPITQLPHDHLSKLDFPGGRLRSYMFFANETGLDKAYAIVIISLMEDTKIEVRIIRGGNDPLYGVFSLNKHSID